MSSNLVNGVTQILSSSVLERLCSSLGLQKAQVESAIRAGVPALLAALSSLASRGSGANALQEAVARQPEGLLTKFASAIGGAGQGTLIDSGNSTLTSLLGSTTTSAVSNAIAKFAGIGGGQSQSIMGMLGSAVMGVLGQQQRARNLDANGLAEMLSSQSDNIARAMPPGFAKYLGGTGILESVAQPEGVSGARDYGGDTAYMRRPAQKSSSMMGWLLPILALALAIGAWQLFSHRDERRAEAPASDPATSDRMATASPSDVGESPSSTGASTGEAGLEPFGGPNFQALDSLRGIRVGDVDFGQQSTMAVHSLRDSLARITDEDSARAQLGALKSSADEFENMSGLANQLPTESRNSVASVIVTLRPTLDQLCDKALQVPGAGEIIRPTIDDIRAKLDTLAASRAS